MHTADKAVLLRGSEIEFTVRAEYFMSHSLCLCVCDLPSVNGDDFDEWVLPDLGQVQPRSSQPPASIFLLTQETNRVSCKQQTKPHYII